MNNLIGVTRLLFAFFMGMCLMVGMGFLIKAIWILSQHGNAETSIMMGILSILVGAVSFLFTFLLGEI